MNLNYIIFTFLILSPLVDSYFKTCKGEIKENLLNQEQTSPQEQAFEVLKIKCNTCHATKRKTDIFTKANMDSFAVDIHKQVFVKQKMPKGRKVKLTEEELETLERWLELTLAKK
ncbi:hypothetical protein [Maribacter aestuarii]|uniref:hypothetical protein n=1 Tax=Maribacter aestuarii TaxID=1130723 RepID=UPI00248B585D|nr:hypothetical protein [Maribacter aestuarii]